MILGMYNSLLSTKSISLSEAKLLLAMNSMAEKQSLEAIRLSKMMRGINLVLF